MGNLNKLTVDRYHLKFRWLVWSRGFLRDIYEPNQQGGP
jgi:hypothetical protein